MARDAMASVFRVYEEACYEHGVSTNRASRVFQVARIEPGWPELDERPQLFAVAGGLAQYLVRAIAGEPFLFESRGIALGSLRVELIRQLPVDAAGAQR